MSLIRKAYRQLLRRRMRAADIAASMLAQFKCRTDIENYQVDCFNMIWRTAWGEVPYYRELKECHKLPDSITSLEELNQWPVLTKADLRDVSKFVRDDVARPAGLCITGGSTGEPVRLPSWGDSHAGVSQMLGRRAYGIEPGDKTLLLWGHEHLYGTGFKRKINVFKRRLKDWLADWTRVSAYNLGVEAMHRAFAELVKCQPKFIIGFSPAVLAFVRQNKEHLHEVKSVRVILCTAGPLSPAEKQEVINFFSTDSLPAPQLCMEYGSVECGIMAYTRPRDGQADVFWNTHLIQAQKQPDGEYKALVTRLTDCYVPLIRYDIGDYLELDPACEEDNARSVLEIISVKGRPSEMLHFKCGVSFFGALIGDCVKQVPEVISSQMEVGEETNKLNIVVTASRELSASELALIKNRFELTVADAGKLDVSVVQKPKLFVTVGGKIPRIVRI